MVFKQLTTVHSFAKRWQGSLSLHFNKSSWNKRHNDKKFNTEKKSEGLEIVLNDFTFTPVTCSFHDYICVTRTEIFFSNLNNCISSLTFL